MSDGKTDRYSVGSGDDGLDDDPVPDPEDDVDENEQEPDVDQSSTIETDSRNPEDAEEEEQHYYNPPHRVQYESPKVNWDAKTFVLESRDKRRLNELESIADEEYPETVHRMDVYLCALRAGLKSDDEEFLEEMRRIGYGY